MSIKDGAATKDNVTVNIKKEAPRSEVPNNQAEWDEGPPATVERPSMKSMHNEEVAIAMEVKKYRKKPVVIEAMKYDENTKQGTVVAEWCGGKQTTKGLLINTLEGGMRANHGDWVIKGVQGEFCPCKPDIFTATYEEVEEE